MSPRSHIIGYSVAAWVLAGAWAFADNEPELMLPEPPAVSSPVVVSSAPAVEPYVCPLAKCTAVSRYGARTVPGKADKEPHRGVDLKVDPGQTVRAARSGRVIFAGFSKEYVSRADKKQQERLIIIVHADRQSSRYVHLNSIAVRPPQMVQAGDAIGTTSESDEWTEPVLHFEIRAANGTPLNPDKFLPKPARKP